MSIARFVTWGGTGILTTETQDFGLIIKYGVSEKVNIGPASSFFACLLTAAAALSLFSFAICEPHQRHY